MRRPPPRQLSVPFDRDLLAVVLPAPIAAELVTALADLLLARAREMADDEERDDAREDHR
jgi:hypothetical protein